MEKLLIEEDLDKKQLYEILEKFVRINKSNGEIVFTSEFSKQSTKNQILLFLLARKASMELELLENEFANPKLLSEKTGLNPNSVRSYLSQLENSKLIAKNKSNYFVPNYNLAKIKEMAEKWR